MLKANEFLKSFKAIEMKKSRRKFLGTSLALGLTPIIKATSKEQSHGLIKTEKSEVEKLKILILGGTSFLGPHQIA